ETDLAFTTSGCLYLASTERELAKFETWHEVARQHQLDTRMLTPREAAAMSGIEGEVAGGMFTPSDGRAEPLVAAPALARDARRRGAAVMEDCAVR
ncbi:MAG: FAD-dependent oxidoreductase, partial [Actinobacteria bacterium]|nr:FAD-binding oxidoreductase [Actinomycetota bacterium]NIS28887.1 FAD-binding oxidoreductase [Actinomycetota bacterium]NIU64322.1 FAD-binding oxidoreductase [Actinomycetota bacterium]NIW26139.1 FAD-dependent oxidoreductase [Actinomycetota bacterium]NIX18708.1 FAD-dependent oxidoreductase [Actinomycetota bacterium]